MRRDFKSALSETANVQGLSKKSTVRSRFKNGRLDRITFVAPYYIYMQHNGFEGSKRNGVMMRLKPTDVVNVALRKSNVLESLITDLAEQRADEVIAKLNFNGQ